MAGDRKRDGDDAVVHARKRGRALSNAREAGDLKEAAPLRISRRSDGEVRRSGGRKSTAARRRPRKRGRGKSGREEQESYP